MTLRSSEDAFWCAVLRVSLYSVLLVGCANAEPAPAENEDPQPSDSCEYRNVFVEFDDPFRVNDGRAEPLRLAILNRAVAVFPELGLEVVADPSEAYWRLFADAWIDRQGNPLVHLGMKGELKLGRHLFVVAMAAPASAPRIRRSLWAKVVPSEAPCSSSRRASSTSSRFSAQLTGRRP